MRTDASGVAICRAELAFDVLLGRDSVDSIESIARFGRENATSFWRFVLIRRAAWSRFVVLGSPSTCRLVAIRSIRSRFDTQADTQAEAQAEAQAENVAKTRLHLGVSACRLVAFRADSMHQATPKTRHKKARFPNKGESGCVYRKVSRVSSLLLIPRANTRVIVRIVRLGLARRWCIVMLASDRRHIGRCI